MKKQSSSLPLRVKLILLALIPLLAFCVFCGIDLKETLDDLRVADEMNRNVESIIRIAGFVDTLQNERKLSEAYIRGEINYDALAAAVEETKSSVEEFTRTLEESTLSSAVTADAFMAITYIDTLRTWVEKKSSSEISVLTVYSEVIKEILRINREFAKRETIEGIGASLSSLNILYHLQDACIQFRSYGMIFFSKRTSLVRNEVLQILETVDNVRASVDNSGLMLSPKADELLFQMITDDAWQVFEEAKNDIFLHYQSGHFQTTESDFIQSADRIIETVHSVIEEEVLYLQQRIRMIQDQNKRLYITSISALVLTLFAVFLLTLFILRAITRPLKLVGASLREISEGRGDLSVSLEQRSGDEIGVLAQYFNNFIDSLNTLMKGIKDETLILMKLGENLSKHMEETASAQNQIQTTVKSMETQAASQNRKVEGSSESMAALIQSLDDLHGLIENQAGVITESSAAVEEMVSNITSISKSNAKASEYAGKLVGAAEEGRTHMDGVLSEIRDIAVRSENLQEANDLISGIASQTNLLAMNAAIEAAHAGEYGKGFAVVADEIRKLAENATQQSQSILKNLQGIIEVINHVVETARSAGNQFESINTMVYEVNRLEKEVDSALSEQNLAGGEVLTALSEMNVLTSRVRDSAFSMKERSEFVGASMEDVRNLSTSIMYGMNEILSGIGSIGEAVEQVRELSQANRSSIIKVTERISVFNLKE